MKKQFDGRPYDLEAKIFSDDGGKSWFTDRRSAEEITFPYYPPVHPQEILLELCGKIKEKGKKK
jgi:hypothetical protein